jgi:hypothetical protein
MMARYVKRKPRIAPDPYSGYIAFDSVTRADNPASPGSATEKGGAWVVLQGTWRVLNNALECAANTDLVSLGSTANGSVQVSATPDTWVLDGPSVVFRLANVSNFLLFNANNGAVNLYSNIGGALTLLATAAVATPAGKHIIKAVFSGTSVGCFFDGVAAITVTLTGAAAALAGIMCGLRGGKSTTDLNRYDDYAVTP